MKILQRALGWIVNAFPCSIFYSSDFMSDLRLDESGDKNLGRSAALGVAIAAGNTMKPGDRYEATWTGVTHRGKDVGDYEMTIRRLR